MKKYFNSNKDYFKYINKNKHKIEVVRVYITNKNIALIYDRKEEL